MFPLSVCNCICLIKRFRFLLCKKNYACQGCFYAFRFLNSFHKSFMNFKGSYFCMKKKRSQIVVKTQKNRIAHIMVDCQNCAFSQTTINLDNYTSLPTLPQCVYNLTWWGSTQTKKGIWPCLTFRAILTNIYIIVGKRIQWWTAFI